MHKFRDYKVNTPQDNLYYNMQHQTVDFVKAAIKIFEAK